MGKTNIEWTDKSWQPLVGCSPVSDGCDNCYAARDAAGRLQNHPDYAGLTEKGRYGVTRYNGKTRLLEKRLDQPLRWRKPCRIFVCSMGDLFHESVPFEYIGKVFAVMYAAHKHTFQVLTKRPTRMLEFLSEWNFSESMKWLLASKEINYRLGGRDPFNLWQDHPLPNVWLGVSAENQKTADSRVPLLLIAPAALRFVSVEPILGPVDLTRLHFEDITNVNALTGHHGVTLPLEGLGNSLDQVIVGGESGRCGRAMHPEWARSLQKQCADAGTAFFFKQWGRWYPDDRGGCMYMNNGYVESQMEGVEAELMTNYGGKSAAGDLLDGKQYHEFPEESNVASQAGL